jgi:hypothetical protein
MSQNRRQLGAIVDSLTGVVAIVVICVIAVGVVRVIVELGRAQPMNPLVFVEYSQQGLRLGPRTARANVLILFDLPCESCAKLHAMSLAVMGRYPDHVQFSWRLSDSTSDPRAQSFLRHARCIPPADSASTYLAAFFAISAADGESDPGSSQDRTGRARMDTLDCHQGSGDHTYRVSDENDGLKRRSATYPAVYINARQIQLPYSAAALDSAVSRALRPARAMANRRLACRDAEESACFCMGVVDCGEQIECRRNCAVPGGIRVVNPRELGSRSFSPIPHLEDPIHSAADGSIRPHGGRLQRSGTAAGLPQLRLRF